MYEIEMYEIGQLIAVNGVRFVYCESKYDNLQQCNLHKLCEIGVDDYGKVFATDNAWYFTNEELSAANKPNPAHWHSLVEHIIKRKYPHLTDEQANNVVTNILDKCFVRQIPMVHELNACINAYKEPEDWWDFFNLFDAGIVGTIEDALSFFCKKCGVAAAIVYDNNIENRVLTLYTTNDAMLDYRSSEDVKFLRVAIGDILHNEAYEIVIVSVNGGFINMAESEVK